MLPTAHIASALAFNRVTGLNARPGPAVLGALLPDMVDKTLAWVLGVAPAARHIGHTPLATLLFTLGASAVMGRRWGASFAAAYAVHLVGDLWHRGHVPWLMPFKKYDVQSQRWQADLSLEALLLETIGAVAIIILLRSPSDGERPSSATPA